MKLEKVRIIPKLEIKNEFLIKGVRYEGLRKIGNPIDFANKYFNEGADQLNVIDIVASLYSRDNLYEIINRITEKVFIPVCVGGGIKNLDHIKSLLECGADRVIINSQALRNVKFIDEINNTFGNQFLTISIEAKKIGNSYYCMMDHGRENSNKTVTNWIQELKDYDVGEIILNSIDNDGIEEGFDTDLLKIFEREKISCPIVINGGAGDLKHFSYLLKNHNLEGVSVATGLHFNRFSIKEIKQHLIKQDINVNSI